HRHEFLPPILARNVRNPMQRLAAVFKPALMLFFFYLLHVAFNADPATVKAPRYGSGAFSMGLAYAFVLNHVATRNRFIHYFYRGLHIFLLKINITIRDNNVMAIDT